MPSTPSQSDLVSISPELPCALTGSGFNGRNFQITLCQIPVWPWVIGSPLRVSNIVQLISTQCQPNLKETARRLPILTLVEKSLLIKKSTLFVHPIASSNIDMIQVEVLSTQQLNVTFPHLPSDVAPPFKVRQS